MKWSDKSDTDDCRDEHVHDGGKCCECGDKRHCCCDCPRFSDQDMSEDKLEGRAWSEVYWD